MVWNSSLARTDEFRLKNVAIKTFMSDPGVHHTFYVHALYTRDDRCSMYRVCPHLESSTQGLKK